MFLHGHMQFIVTIFTHSYRNVLLIINMMEGDFALILIHESLVRIS
jgi:hypothetical protein